jgi:hypothetical protein
VSDEMYALSTISSLGEDVKPGVQSFVSALQIAGMKQDDVKGGVSPMEKIVDADYSKIHVVWGMSKDFGSSGIRMVRLHYCLPTYLPIHSTLVSPLFSQPQANSPFISPPIHKPLMNLQVLNSNLSNRAA